MNELGFFAIFISALLINNILLIRFLALCSFFGVSDNIESSLGMSMAVTFVMTISTAISYFIYYALLNPETSVVSKLAEKPVDLTYLRTAVFILTIASLVQFEEMVMKKYMKDLYRALGIYLPLITTNCAILAVAFLAVDYKLSFGKALVYNFGVSSGYSLVIIIFSGIRYFIDLACVPEQFRGYPIIFFTAALMSLAFLGFKGLFGL